PTLNARIRHQFVSMRWIFCFIDRLATSSTKRNVPGFATVRMWSIDGLTEFRQAFASLLQGRTLEHFCILIGTAVASRFKFIDRLRKNGGFQIRRTAEIEQA